MKKILLTAFLAFPCFAMAQSEWTLPESSQPKKTEKKQKKASATSNDKTADMGQAKAVVSEIDAKYAAGTVPEVDGRVVFETTLAASGVSADSLYERTIRAITALTKESKQHETSRITVVNKHEHIIAAAFDEEMIFSSTAIAKDFTDVKYTLIAQCYDGSVTLKMMRISYLYEKGRSSEATYKAEELITDREAINKKGTKLYRQNSKFRTKTIDRKDEVFGFIASRLKD